MISNTSKAAQVNKNKVLTAVQRIAAGGLIVL